MAKNLRGAPVTSLEDFVLNGTYWSALTLIGPAYASRDMQMPSPPHTADVVAKLGHTFLSAVRRFDERELLLPSYDLLNIDFALLAAWVDRCEGARCCCCCRSLV